MRITLKEYQKQKTDISKTHLMHYYEAHYFQFLTEIQMQQIELQLH